MFEGGGGDARFLGVFVRLVPAVRVMADRFIVATASPPFAEGGHLVMARELVRALEECGHAASLLVTPQNRFGRQGSAYLAAWCTDVVGRARGAHASIRSSRCGFPAYAVRHDRHVVWLNHRMREYYDLWDQFASHLSSAPRSRSACGARIIHRVDRHLLTSACSGAS